MFGKSYVKLDKQPLLNFQDEGEIVSPMGLLRELELIFKLRNASE